MIFKRALKAVVITLIVAICGCKEQNKEQANQADSSTDAEVKVTILASSFTGRSNPDQNNSDATLLQAGQWLAYDLPIEVAGRYRVSIMGTSKNEGRLWIEDYVDNKDGRTYDITGKLNIGPNQSAASVDGTPLNNVVHKIKLHSVDQDIKLDQIEFVLMVEHQETPQKLTQQTEEGEWQIVWSDEFDGTTIDTSKWTYDIGDWGWGNNELQYYTANRKENARVESGNLIIEARKNKENDKWTSARLTTRGKTSFTYGKIELRAQVPREKGNWAAGWTLGDSYRDEISWPYCGEIDILESVGYEVDNESGDGKAHVTVHTPAYYFKINNQISNVKDITNIAGAFHTYSVEWTPTEVRGFVDGEDYYLYDKTANELEWPFNEPQNIILNLAMGGGWGGAQGMDSTITSQKFIIDYVRVLEKK